MKVINALKRYFQNTALIAKKSQDLHEGMNNQSTLINQRLNELKESIKNQSDLINRKMNELIQCTRQLADVSKRADINNGLQAPPHLINVNTGTDGSITSFEAAMQAQPLMFARKTFNTSHPEYDANLARNFPGKIFNLGKDNGNSVYAELKKLIQDNEIAESQWGVILREMLEEAKTVPHAEQVFERKAYVERYIEELETKYGAFYKPGWVNLEDALFLYWVVRKLKPKAIVQAGVCNGLSSAFMMLALAKNGPEGTLHVVDMPPVFDSKDPNWKVKGKVYGVVIPEGKSSGWLVPDAYRSRFEVLNGDAKDLLPGLLKKVGSIDMFYHDSDHTYDHMIFEFTEAKKYLTKHGVIVSDDISWNASLWDFADQYLAPAYNYRGSMGIACF